MKKVININFQGRVVPIEDSAYDLLQQYIASLRTYFANEEGRDEIINDIESRIGELFEEQLKKGAACITDDGVTAIMDSMGRPSDFEKVDEAEPAANPNTNTSSSNANPNTGAPWETFGTGAGTGNRRLYRDEQDKILGGVASGLATYFNIDPAIVRILFAISVFLGGAGFLIYVILWIALPSKSLVNNIRKRLYRDTDDRIFKGVCGGLAKYFDVNPILPRIVFAAPFLFGIITTLGRSFFVDIPVIIGGFSGGSFIIAYLILWAVLPEAVTASEKLEMKGEKVDLNSIRDTIMEDMQGFKGRAEKIKTDVQESTSRIMKNTQTAWKSQGRPFVNEASGTVRRHAGGLGNAIGVLVKAFVMIIGGIIAFALAIALIAILSTGIGRLQLTDFILNGFWQKIFGWGVLLLFIGAPIMAIVISIIRRMMRAKTGGRYISYLFSGLWLMGLFCLIVLMGLISRDIRYDQPIVSDFQLSQPSNNKLMIQMASSNIAIPEDNWFNWDGALVIENDSLYLNTIKVHVVKSNDNLYHVHVVKFSKGGTLAITQQRSEKIQFPIEQNDSIIYLPESFAIGVADKWRNQRVLVVVEVPVGAIVNVSSDLNAYNYFDVSFNRRRTRNRSIDRHWYDDQTWNSNKDMIQTNEDGLKRAGKYDEKTKTYRYKDEDDDNENDWDNENERRQNPPPAPAAPPAIQDSTRRTDTAYRYPARTAQVKQSVKKVVNTTGTIYISPLASFLW